MIALSGCGTTGGQRDNGTAAMAARLQQIYQEARADPLPYVHMNRRKVELLLEALKRQPSMTPQTRYSFAYELLNAGDVDDAIREMQVLVEPSGTRIALSPRTKSFFDLLGIAYLVKGERHGCLDHAPDGCVAPSSSDSNDPWKQATRRAVALYKHLLDSFPGDLQTRWLLNVAYLTLGQYPDSVPKQWLIPGLERSSDARLPRFRNVAPELGLAVNGMAGGVSLEDFNGDGFIDVLTTAYGLNDPLHLFLADGRGGFIDRTHAAGLQGIVSGLNTIHADYDNDGDVDVLILRGAWLGAHGAHPNSLLRNNGDGTFEDVTAAAGLLSLHPTQTAAWGDFDNDGLLDLFIGNESGGAYQGMGAGPQSSDSGAEQLHRSELFRNNGDGTFTEVSARAGIDVSAFVKGVAWGDANNDGLPDLFVSVLGGPNRLYLNRGGTGPDNWHFDDVAAAAGVQQPQFSFGCWFWDYDNDGWEDLFVASYDPRDPEPAANVARDFLNLPVQGDRAHLFHNNGDGTFSNVAPALGLDRVGYVMGANYGDLDNDGHLDLYLGTGGPDPRAQIPNRLFLNRSGKRFDDVTFDGGFGRFAKGHAIAFADLDRDGDQDIYAVMGGSVEGDAAPNVLLENPNPSPRNSWVGLQLEGRTANRSAVGARIRIAVQDQDGQRWTIYRTVSTGGSFGASSLEQEIGLGPASRIAELQITWPNRRRTTATYSDLAVDRYYRVVEDAAIRGLAWHPIKLR
jgi:hypothetical protein